MLKKIIILALGLLLVFSMTAAYGNTTSQQEIAGAYLKDLGLYQGYDDGSLGLERPITRAEFATLVVRMVGEEAVSKKQVDTVFKDVKANHWGSGYINTAVNRKLVQGYSDQTFKPEGNITYAEAVTMMIRLLGYENTATGEWPQSHLTVANNLGMTKGLSYNANHIVNRGDVAIIIKQSLGIQMK